MHRLTILLAALALGACASGPSAYGPADRLGSGYRDQQIDGSHYEVTVRGNESTIEARVWTYWIYRCAELTKQKGFSYFALADPPGKRAHAASISPAPTPSVLDGIAAPELSDGVLRPDGHSAYLQTGQSEAGSVVVGGQTAKPSFYSTDSVVSMYNDPLPLQAGVVYQAQTILDAYDEYVHAPPPVALEDHEVVMARARVLSPLGEAYVRFGLNLIIRLNPGQTVTQYNLDGLDQPIKPRFPRAGEWTPVPYTSRFVNDESVIHGKGAEISFVIATEDEGTKPNSRFDRFHVDCASLVGHQIAGGHVNLADFQPPLSTLPRVSDTMDGGHALEGDEKKAAQTACKNAEARA